MKFAYRVFMAAVAVLVPVSAWADGWAAGVTTATTGLSADLVTVGGTILGLVCLIYGFRVVKGMIHR